MDNEQYPPHDRFTHLMDDGFSGNGALVGEMTHPVSCLYNGNLSSFGDCQHNLRGSNRMASGTPQRDAYAMRCLDDYDCNLFEMGGVCTGEELLRGAVPGVVTRALQRLQHCFLRRRQSAERRLRVFG